MHSPRRARSVAAALVASVLLPVAPAAASQVTLDHSQVLVVGPDEDAGTPTQPQLAAASSGDTITFNGRGTFHSIGMSQHGAHGQAIEGRTARDIIETYYEGATVDARPIAFDIRVAVQRDTTTVRLVPRGGAAAIYFTDGGAAITAEPGTGWVVTVDSDGECHTSGPGVADRTTCPLFDPNARLEVQRPSSSGWVAYGQYARDAVVDVVADRTGAGWRLDTVVELPLEQYLYGLAEVPYSWDTDALQAQAIAGRSYAQYRMRERGSDPDGGCSCHVWDSQQDQVYRGWEREVSEKWDRWRAAVDASTDRVVVADGEVGTRDGVVQAFYSASSHGHTENVHEVFFATWPYMVTVPDPWSLEAPNNPYASWERTFDRATVASRVGLDRVDAVVVTERRESGSAKTIEFRGETTKTLTSAQVRGLFGLPSYGFGIDGESWEVDPTVDLFTDDDGSPHEQDIDWLANRGITRGCNPPDNTEFCPDAPVTRAQMATFLLRALGLEAGPTTAFRDVPSDSIHASAIGALAREDITRGCNPPDNDRFCPNDPVTRAQMATFLLRALGLAQGPADAFEDVPPTSTHAHAIGALAREEITKGCNPPTNTRFCPDAPVSRAQMASFLRRALG